MTREEIDNTKYKVCCPTCENKICVKGTVSCEAEHWAKSQQGDAISRQMVKEQMIKYGFHASDMTVTEFVEGLPSVSTEKTGQWIKRENEFGLFECSVCKGGYIDQPTCMGKPMFKYCPCCGAKMGVEE